MRHSLLQALLAAGYAWNDLCWYVKHKNNETERRRETRCFVLKKKLLVICFYFIYLFLVLFACLSVCLRLRVVVYYRYADSRVLGPHFSTGATLQFLLRPRATFGFSFIGPSGGF